MADNAQEMLDKASDAFNEWTDEYAERIPVNPRHRTPNKDGKTDYNEHHHTVSAPPEIDDELNARLFQMCEQRQRDIGK